MSNFKRFLALALASLMVVGMMVFTAPAASAYEAQGVYKDSITLLNKFDVMLGDGDSFDEKGQVTRWQMALFIARIVTGETGNAMWMAKKSDVFTDVFEEHFPGAIDFCAEMGYIKGVGDNKFEPDEPITYRDALTMLVRLVGKETKDMSYPWGYILEARSISNTKGKGLTDDVNVSYTANLLREEVADLLAKAIYIDIDPTVLGVATYASTSLKCNDLGTKTLLATETFALAQVSPAAAGYLNLDGEMVKVANATKESDVAWTYYLGATAQMYSIKGVVYADFGTATVSDVTANADGDIKVGGKVLSLVTYGTAIDEFFVPYAAAAGESGRLITVQNGYNVFVPFNTVRAYYAQNVSVKKTDGWPADSTVTVYYKAQDGTSMITNNEIVNGAFDASGLLGKVSAGKITVGITDSTTDTAIRTSLKSNTYIPTTSLRVTVDGNLINGEMFVGNVSTVGSYSFITVGSYPSMVKGTAVLTAILANEIKLGDTTFEVGYTVGGAQVDNYYTTFADLDNTIGANIASYFGEKVDYLTIDGKVVSLSLHTDSSTEEDPVEKQESKYAKDAFAVVFYADGTTGVTANADNTLTLSALDLATATVKSVKVSQINGTNLAKLVNDYGVTVAANILGCNGITKLGDLVEAMLGATQTSGNFTLASSKKVARVALASVANKVGEVYSLSNDITALKQVFIGAAVGGAIADDSVTLLFKKYEDAALSTTKYTTQIYDAANSTATVAKYKTGAGNYLTLTAASEIIVLSKDGVNIIKNVVPETNQFLNLCSSLSAGQFVLELSNTKIVIVNFTDSYAAITNIKAADKPVDPGEVKADWYTLTWNTKYAGCEVVTQGGKSYFNYTFDNMYNMTTKKLESVVISRTNYISSNVAKTIFGDRWAGTGVACESNAQMKTIVTAKAAFYQPFYISSELGSADNGITSSMVSYALANGYEVGLIKEISYADQNTLRIKNLVATAKNGYYILSENASTAKDTDVVISSTMFVFNISNTANKDEIGLLGSAATVVGVSVKDDTTYQAKAQTNTLYNSDAEVVLYKFNQSTGKVELIVNYADRIGGSTLTAVVDVCAKEN